MLEKISLPVRRVVQWADRARLQPIENQEPFPADSLKEELRQRELARQIEQDEV